MGNSLNQFNQNFEDNLATVLNNVFDGRNPNNGGINENRIWTIVSDSNTSFYNRLFGEFGELARWEWVGGMQPNEPVVRGNARNTTLPAACT